VVETSDMPPGRRRRADAASRAPLACAAAGETTVDLDAHRAVSDLDELALDQEQDVEAA
jgi:hypothetical protein